MEILTDVKPRLLILALPWLLTLSAHATVNTQSLKVSFNCTGSTGPFPFSFPISDPTALTVTENGVTIPSTGYTITPLNNNYNNGGSITLSVACPASPATTLVLQRITPILQKSVFADNMPLPMKSFENGLDKLTEISQEIQSVPENASCEAGQVIQQLLPLICVDNTAGAAGNPAAPAFAVQLANSGVTSFQADPNITINPTTHNFTAPAITPSGAGITDWYDHTGGCVAYRGEVNVLDCGAVADGAFQAGGCGQTAPVGCFHGTDNTVAIRKAIAAVSISPGTGVAGKVYFPNSGTNLWMVGAPYPAETDECTLNSTTGYYGIFSLPNNVVLEGTGRWTTTIMSNPGVGHTRTCAMVQNSQQPMLGVQIRHLRLDGNEGTDATHTDFLHPQNNFSTNITYELGLLLEPGNQVGVHSLTMSDFVISGMQGGGTDGPQQYASNFIGATGAVALDDGYIAENEWSTWVMKDSDSILHNIYWADNGNWNNFEGAAFYDGGTKFSDNYFGGGAGGTAQILLVGSHGSQFTNTVVDNNGGGNIRLIDDTGSYPSVYNTFVNTTVSQPGTFGTPAPFISIEGHAFANMFTNTFLSNGPNGHSTYGIQELGSATNNMFVNTVANSTSPPASGLYNLSAGSRTSNSQGSADTFINWNGPSTGGAMNASVNSQINVMAAPYNAKGDCSTDDHGAIIAAQTAAQTYAVGSNAPAALYFPKPPGGCYLTSTIEWTGVSMIGQPAGVGVGSPTTAGVVIKGKPGQDVLHVPDPTTTSFTWNSTWTIRDLTFMEDTSSAGSFSHRWPGRWFDDAHMASGSAAITTTAGDIYCGDVGQAIQVNGAGASGANLVTTIASVDPCWANAGSATSWKVVTLAAAASTTVTNAHAYVSLLGLPVTATVGACAIAMDDVDANEADWVNPAQRIGSLYPTMDNVSFIGFDGPANNACGFYVQGEHGLYGLTVNHSHIQYEAYGVVQGASELNSYYASNAGDFETWRNVLIGSTFYPWISYNGGEMRWEDIEMTVQAGPQILSLGNQWANLPGTDTLNIAEFETYGTGTTYGLRITGVGHVLNSTELAPSGMSAYIDAAVITCNGCFTGGSTPSYLYGAGNKITGMSLGTVIVDKGRGNTVTGNFSGSFLDSLPLNSDLSFTPVKADNLINSFLPSFLDAGYPTTPYKNADMWMFPKDFIVGNNSGANPWSSYYQDDSNSLSGGEFNVNAGGNFIQWYQFPQSNTYHMTIGSQIPASTGILYFSGLCPAGITTEDLGVTSTDGYAVAGSQSCSTSLQNYQVAYNLTGHTGNVGIKNFLGTGNNFWLAWAYFQPTPALPAGTTIGNTVPVQNVCPEFTQALSTASIAPGGATTQTATCTGAVTTDSVKCQPYGTTFHGVVGYDPALNSGDVLTVDPPTVTSANTVTFYETSSLLNTITFSPGAMTISCHVTR